MNNPRSVEVIFADGNAMLYPECGHIHVTSGYQLQFWIRNETDTGWEIVKILLTETAWIAIK